MSQVQLALLTATVKLFIRRPTAASGLLPKILKMATEDAENPDLRDRVSCRSRLMSTQLI
jgi:AP-2 complex subunit beta-1